MQPIKKSVWLILSLIAVLSAALALLGAGSDTQATTTPPKTNTTAQSADGIVTLNTTLVQDKILIGSDGRIAIALDLIAGQVPEPATGKPRQRIDLAVVLDRSGSMQGQKLEDGREAIVRMLEWLTPEDRLSLVVYDDTIQTLFPLASLDASHRRRFVDTVRRIQAGGGTNLGGGLQAGIEALQRIASEGRQRKVILISDGQANHGITDPDALGRMAAGASSQGIAVSTVGVGYDFNEFLMTGLADHGAGRYHFLENPQSFAAVLQHEFEATRNVVASGLEIRVPLKEGMRVVDAGGYPVATQGDMAVIQPGDLLSGGQRRIFLTLQLPTDRERRHSIDGLQVRYQHEGKPFTLAIADPLTVACVADKTAVLGSIDRSAWGEQVVQEDFGRLKETVADAIRRGEKKSALTMIQDYEARNREINASVASPQVAENLDSDVQALRQNVEDTFSGPPAQVAAKQKQNAKSLHYEGYQIRRDKK